MGNAASALTQSSGPATSPVPLAPGSSNTQTTEEKEPKRSMVIAHAVLLCLAFFFFMPSAVFVLRLPFTQSFGFQGHFMLQIVSWMLAVAGLVIAIVFSKQSGFSKINKYHQIIGIVVIALTIVQPLGGVFHHWQFKKSSSRSIVSYTHIVVGWIIIFLGMLNGTFGLRLAENDRGAGGLGAAGIVILISMLGVSAWAAMGQRKSQPSRPPKKDMEHIPSS